MTSGSRWAKRRTKDERVAAEGEKTLVDAPEVSINKGSAGLTRPGRRTVRRASGGEPTFHRFR